MMVEIQEMKEAFNASMTMNVHGKELAIADLLKNHVFCTANNEITYVRLSRYLMIVNLDSIDPTKFIRHYWNTQYHFVSEKALYLNIRHEIDSAKYVCKL